MSKARETGLRIFVHVGAWLPLLWIIWRFSQDSLTANPIREIQLETGRIALTILLLSLVCTPVYNITGFVEVRHLRRTLGLYAFLYICLHFLNFIGLDYSFNLSMILDAIGSKRFPLAGLTSFVLLIPLAVTSTKGWIKRLGKNWERLHMLVYPAAVLGVLHYIWAAKAIASIRVPLIYAAALVLLFILRIPPIRDVLIRRVPEMEKG